MDFILKNTWVGAPVIFILRIISEEKLEIFLADIYLKLKNFTVLLGPLYWAL
jgi:hypothetical protein